MQTSYRYADILQAYRHPAGIQPSHIQNLSVVCASTEFLTQIQNRSSHIGNDSKIGAQENSLKRLLLHSGAGGSSSALSPFRSTRAHLMLPNSTRATHLRMNKPIP